MAMELQERSVAPPSHYVPDDIVLIEILTWLPAKTLWRLKQVSRTWCKTISSDPLFVVNQSRRQTYLSSGKVYYCNGRQGLGFLSTPSASVGVPDPFLGFRDAQIIDLLASVHGLLLLLVGFGSGTFFYVCNPATGKGERIPRCIDPYPFDVGLAFDPWSSPDRYTLINPISLSGKSEQFPLRFRLDKFSSTTGQWTASSAEMPEVKSGRTPSTVHFAGGVLYWYYRHYYILSYDTFEDAAEEMKLPGLQSPGIWMQELGVWEEKLTCTQVVGDFIQVWVMRTKGNWEMRHNVPRTIVERTLTDFRDPSCEITLRPVLMAYEVGKNISLKMRTLFNKGKKKETIVVFDTESGNSTVLREIRTDFLEILYQPLSYHNGLVALPTIQCRSPHSTAR